MSISTRTTSLLLVVLAGCSGAGRDHGNASTAGADSGIKADSAAGQVATPASPNSAPSAAPTSASAAPSDAQIFAILGEANHAEIDAANVALQKASHNRVKSFARQMIHDHTMLLHKGDALAQRLNVTPQPPANDSLAQHVQQEKQALGAAAAGPAFDKQYMDAQVQDHQTVYALLQQFAGQAQNAQLKTLITQAEPIVHQHLTRAQSIDASLGAPQS
jgi:putative membrane protein